MAARAVSMFDQRGCVSPHAIYVEEGGAVDPGEWAALLASAMADLEVEIPGGYLTTHDASAVHQMRGSAELREASGGGVRVFRGDESFWTVILEDEMSFTPSCLNRVVSLVPTPDLGGVAGSLGRLGGICRQWQSKVRKIVYRCWRRRSAGPAPHGLRRSKRRPGHHPGGATMALQCLQG